MLPGMLELVDLLVSESIQLSGEKLFMLASMCESKRVEWFGVSQFAHIHVTFVWFSAS